MKINLEWKRILHLIVLIIFTGLLGQILIKRFEWKQLSAYGLSCSLVCQISNAIFKINEMNLENGEDSKKKAKRAGSVRKKRNKSN